MAGALLTAAGLPELITHDLDNYAERAVALAQNPARCLALRAKLATVRESGTLFDTPELVRALEQRLKALVQALPPTPTGA
jgi:predicted O-linked N-acetylglucosamine transferase (SPINDLY family)